jgi:hypothetical protein
MAIEELLTVDGMAKGLGQTLQLSGKGVAARD